MIQQSTIGTSTIPVFVDHDEVRIHASSFCPQYSHNKFTAIIDNKLHEFQGHAKASVHKIQHISRNETTIDVVVVFNLPMKSISGLESAPSKTTQARKV